MSIQAVAWALEQEVKDSAAKLVLISLCNAHNGDTGLCCPSHARLAAEASVSTRTVIRKLQWLEENGWIDFVPSFAKGGRQGANNYRLMMNDGGDSVSYRGDNGVTGEGDNCVTPLKKPEEVTGNKKLTKKAQITSVFMDSGISEETAEALYEHRKTIRKPLTKRAAELLVGEFQKTGNSEDAANSMIMNGWQGFKADWQSQRRESGSDKMIAAFMGGGDE